MATRSADGAKPKLNRTERFELRLSKKEVAALKKLAELWGMSAADALRQLLRNCMEQSL